MSAGLEFTQNDSKGFNEFENPKHTISKTYVNPNSFAFRFRAKRFQNIKPIIEKIIAEKGECRICDIGGTEFYWEIFGDFCDNPNVKIDLFNLEEVEVKRKNFRSFAADATDMSSIADNSYDLVHSNSVIEHVGNWENMKKMAQNIKRIAPRYYVQTPNIWFPLEPHFRVIGFALLPVQVRAWLLTTFNLGFCGKIATFDEALSHLETVQLLDSRQMKCLFPDAQVKFEKVFGLNKSIMAIMAD